MQLFDFILDHRFKRMEQIVKMRIFYRIVDLAINRWQIYEFQNRTKYTERHQKRNKVNSKVKYENDTCKNTHLAATHASCIM